jgi:hypothetical protein
LLPLPPPRAHGWFSADRTDWSDDLCAGILALRGIERDPPRMAT